MRVIVNTDGGARGNPGPAGAGVTIHDEEGRLVFSRGYYLGRTTNNVAEYEGLLRGLRQAEQLGATEVVVFCDSELIVRQVNGQYRVKNPQLKVLYQQVTEQMARFAQVTVGHVYREDNAQADALVNQAIDQQEDVAGAAEQIEPTTSPAGAKSLVQIRDLSNLLEADSDKVRRELLIEESGLKVALFCVPQGRHCRIKPSWSQSTMMVVRGRGIVRVDEETENVARGYWLQVAKAAMVELQADAAESLAVVVTGVR